MNRNQIFKVFVLLSLGLNQLGWASNLATLKQVQVIGGSQIDLVFDGKVQPSQIKTEYINDIVQLSISDAAVYPAKISSLNGAKVSKIFAYQYAPKLVRCRFTVKGKADQFKDQLQVKARGKLLSVSFEQAAPVPVAAVAPVGAPQLSHPQSQPDVDPALVKKVMAEDSISTTAAHPAAAAPVKASASEATPIEAPKKRDLKVGGAVPKINPFGMLAKLGMVLIAFGVGALGLRKWMLSRGENRHFFEDGESNHAMPEPEIRKAVAGGIFGLLGSVAKSSLSRKPKLIEVLSNHYLGPKKSISVVRVGGRVLVLGVTNESINLITQLNAADGELNHQIQAAVEGGLTQSNGPSFDQALGQASPVKPAGMRAYTLNQPTAPSATASTSASSARAQIRSRLEGMKQL